MYNLHMAPSNTSDKYFVWENPDELLGQHYT